MLALFLNVRYRASLSLLLRAACICLLSSCSLAQGSMQNATTELTSTTWQLVEFRGGDDKTLTPDDRSKYTLAFAGDGNVSSRLDCNRGRGTWKSSGPNQLEMGPLALTRAMCPAGSLSDRIARDWMAVRSYVLKDGHLFLSLMADGGTYEFEPITQSESPGDSPVVVRGPFNFECSRQDGAPETFKATYYQTEPGLLLLQHENQTRPAFQVRSGSGAKYAGQDVIFWEAHSEATVMWFGVERKCKLAR